MAIADDEVFGAPPKKLVVHEIGQPLDRLSVEEIGERIEALQTEIARLEATRVSKQASKDAADALFRES